MEQDRPELLGLLVLGRQEQPGLELKELDRQELLGQGRQELVGPEHLELGRQEP